MPARLSSAETPPLTDTQVRILDAARDLFFSEGFSAVSTDRLSREASVSKTSIYKYFGDMGGVFASVVRREGDVFELGFSSLPDAAPEFWSAMSSFGARLLMLLNQGFCIQFDRMLHEAARSQPDLVKRFYDLAYGRGHTEITAFIAHGQSRGFIAKPQKACDLADNLLSMWNGLAFVQARLGMTDCPFPDPEGWARQCVETLFAEDWKTCAANAG